jgi:hypothetical protein
MVGIGVAVNVGVVVGGRGVFVGVKVATTVGVRVGVCVAITRQSLSKINEV